MATAGRSIFGPSDREFLDPAALRRADAARAAATVQRATMSLAQPPGIPRVPGVLQRLYGGAPRSWGSGGQLPPAIGAQPRVVIHERVIERGAPVPAVIATAPPTVRDVDAWWVIPLLGIAAVTLVLVALR